MRSVLLSLIIAASLPVTLAHPYIGVLVFSWVSYMNPHKMTWGFGSGVPWAFIVGATTFLAWLFSRDNKKLPMTPIVVLMLIFTFWCGITTAMAYNAEAAQVYYIQYFKIMAMTFLTIILFQDQRRLNLLIWVIVCSIGYFGFRGGIFSLLTGGQFLVWGPPGGMIADNNALALALIMVAPLVRYLHLQSKRRWVKLGLLASMPFFLVAIITTYSRGAFLALGVTAVYLAMKSRYRLRMALLLIVVLAATLNFMPQRFFDRMQTIETYNEESSAISRLNAWGFAWRVALDHPIFGGGFDVSDWPPMWPKYAPGVAYVQTAHSIYLQVLSTQGFVGLLIYLVIHIMAFRANTWVMKHVKRRPDLLWLRDLSAMTQVSLIGFASAGVFQNLAFFDLPWHMVAVSMLARLIAERELAKEPTGAQPAQVNPDARYPWRRPKTPAPAFRGASYAAERPIRRAR